MDKTTFDALTKMNKNFYTTMAKEFNVTRQYPWKGWGRVIDSINDIKKTKPHIVDLGCGNGRFYKYCKNNLTSFTYTGYDINTYLLNRAQDAYPEANFVNKDVLAETDSIQKADVMVAFGLTHHIPSQKYRKSWLIQVARRLKSKGLLALTFWNIAKDTRFENKIIKAELSLDKNDYLLNWGNTDTPRYYHKYSKGEIKDITANFRYSGLDLLTSYSSDGKGDKLNTYLIFLASK